MSELIEMVPKVVRAEPVGTERLINGRRVTLIRRVPHRENKEIQKLISHAQEHPDDWDAQIPVLCRMVESWQFEGDPKDPASYQDLDDFDEFWPLVMFMSEYLADRANRMRALKN